MTTAAMTSQPASHVSFRRLLWVGPLTIAAAMVANFFVQQIAVALLQPDPLFQPLTPATTLTFTFIGVLGAVIVFALVARFAANPIPLFRRIAVIALLISLIPDVMLAVTGFMPGATVANVLALMVMHVVAWAISVYMLTTLTRE